MDIMEIPVAAGDVKQFGLNYELGFRLSVNSIINLLVVENASILRNTLNGF